MIQNNNTPELPGSISTRMSGIFSTFYLGLMGRWSAWIVLLASLLITFNAWYFVRDEANKKTQARFDFRVKIIKTEIYDRLQAYELLLRGGRGFFAASDEVTREDWRTYVTKLQINQYYPGIQGVGFSKQIIPSEKEAHIRQIRSQGFPQYTIKPEGDRPEYTSIIFLEPFDWRNQRAFGYDMFSEPTRKKAMIRARDTGVVALSGKVTLVQETSKDVQAGFLIYLAIYRKGEPLETPEQRGKALMGYVYSPFRMNEFMKGLLIEKEEYVNLQIFDGEQPLKKTLLYKSDSTEESYNAHESRSFATDQSILKYAGHRWLLSFVSSKHFEENIETGSMNFILLLGITISLLLFGMVFLSKSRSQAIAMANTTLDLEKANIELRKEIIERKKVESLLQESEEKYRNIFDTESDAIFLIDKETGAILEVNNAACNLYGYTQDELIRLKNTEISAEPEKTMQATAEMKKSIPLRYHKKKDGTIFPVDISASIFVLKGTDVILSAIRDITERKKTEDLLQQSENRLKLSLAGADLGMWDWNIADGSVVFNERWAEMLGYRLDEIEPNIQTWETLVHPDDMPHVEETLTAHIEGKTDNYKVEHRLRHKEGRWAWVLSSGRLIQRDFQGKALRACGTHLDITERKRSDVEREQLISKLQNALEQIKTLKGLLPICASCKKIRDDKGYWNILESYIEKHTDAQFSHGMCPECSDKFYGNEDWYIKMKKTDYNGFGGQ